MSKIADVLHFLSRVANSLGGEHQSEGVGYRVSFRGRDEVGAQAFNFLGHPLAHNSDQFIALFALGADWEVFGAGRDSRVLWVRWGTTANGDPVHVLQWAKPGTTWSFSLVAGTQSDLDSFATQFVRAASDALVP